MSVGSFLTPWDRRRGNGAAAEYVVLLRNAVSQSRQKVWWYQFVSCRRVGCEMDGSSRLELGHIRDVELIAALHDAEVSLEGLSLQRVEDLMRDVDNRYAI